MNKPALFCARWLYVVFLISIISFSVFAVIPDPGHSAASVGAGIFGAGNFTFQNSILVQQNVNVTGTIYGSSNALNTQDILLKDPTGFPDRTTTTLSFVAGTRNFTLVGTYTYYINGTAYTRTNESVIVPNTKGIHFIYYDDGSGLKQSTSAWTFKSIAQVATVYWDGSKGLIGDERHGIDMDWKTHEYIHETIGTRFASGLAANFTDSAFTMGSGEFYDDDNEFITGTITNCTLVWRNGANWTWATEQTQYFYKNATNMYYDNGGTLTAVNANSYTAVWLFATNVYEYPVICMVGQRTDGTVADARANNNFESLSYGTMPVPEMKVLYRVILRNDASPYEEAQDLRSISNVPAGSYVATSHSTLTGLTADDHPQYLLGDGTRAMTGNLTFTTGQGINASYVLRAPWLTAIDNSTIWSKINGLINDNITLQTKVSGLLSDNTTIRNLIAELRTDNTTQAGLINARAYPGTCSAGQYAIATTTGGITCVTPVANNVSAGTFTGYYNFSNTVKINPTGITGELDIARFGAIVYGHDLSGWPILSVGSNANYDGTAVTISNNSMGGAMINLHNDTIELWTTTGSTANIAVSIKNNALTANNLSGTLNASWIRNSPWSLQADNTTQAGLIAALTTSNTSQAGYISALTTSNTSQAGYISALTTSNTSQAGYITGLQTDNSTQAGLINARLPLAGGTMTGNINMNTNYNLTSTNCIVFASGGKICSGT